MATRTNSKRKTTGAKQPKTKGLSDNQRWAYGLILLGVAVFLLVSVASYYFFWRDDQGAALWGETFSTGGEVGNLGGKVGAVVSEYIVGGWFGVFGICIPIVLVILALRIMYFRPAYLRKSVRLTLILMILGSVALGYIFGETWGLFGSGLGGAHGIYIARWLNSVLGRVGAGLLLLLGFVIYAVYINRNTISFINRMARKAGETVSAATDNLFTKDELDEQPEEGDEDTVYPESARVTWTEDEDGFDIRTQGESPFRDEETEIIRPAGDDDFTIIDRSGMLEGAGAREPAVASSRPETQVDENGFTITDLSPVSPAPVPTLPPRSGFREEVDENGFTVQYPVEDPGFVAAVPDYLDVAGDDRMRVEQLPGDPVLTREQIESALYDPTLDLPNYQRPLIELLEDHRIDGSVTNEEIIENKDRIKDTLENFGIQIDKIKATVGPTVTLYEIVPAPGVRISKIKNLEDDIALNLSALGIRIIAPMPGKGTIGIEVPNKDKQVVSMYSVIASAKFQDSAFDIPLALGKTIQNETYVIDLAKMPHLLVAGATGQGKSVGLNAVITSLLYRKHPSELKLVLVDPKKVELTLYSKLERHFLAKMEGEDDAIITDTQKVIYTLKSLCEEMETRYTLLRMAEVRHITEYNKKFKNRRLNPNKGHRFLPYIVVVIDEFADLIMTAGREVETPLARLAQLARAIGIHLVIATQRPTTNIITGVIKANFPVRIAFRVISMIDSRTILDQSGANQLIGRGDMLVSTGADMVRVQCAFVDTPEIERITEFISNQRGYQDVSYNLPRISEEGAGDGINDLGNLDSMFGEIARFVVMNQQGSTSSVQRRFSIGYNRAGRIMDQLEMAGIVGRPEGSKPREVLIQDLNSLDELLGQLLNG